MPVLRSTPPTSTTWPARTLALIRNSPTLSAITFESESAMSPFVASPLFRRWVQSDFMKTEQRAESLRTWAPVGDGVEAPEVEVHAAELLAEELARPGRALVAGVARLDARRARRGCRRRGPRRRARRRRAGGGRGRRAPPRWRAGRSRRRRRSAAFPRPRSRGWPARPGRRARARRGPRRAPPRCPPRARPRRGGPPRPPGRRPSRSRTRRRCRGPRTSGWPCRRAAGSGPRARGRRRRPGQRA